ncbi:MAG: quinoprotein dehydrogenase-associated SoxYZ-like carrier [Notoacmeibacter sp.]|nr:quinoprotein dehydrogenase-associated SoxYZ-like carrier [Notoacmeibacter sp.]MCC0031945.1 quinoprotein dehydrogenase-associated SoxYZ-like carrier [Brucellaceae bacterium]
MARFTFRTACVVLACLSAPAGPSVARAGTLPADPLNSVMWEDMAARFLPGGPIVFDQRVKVLMPRAAEDQFFVPVTVDASALGPVSEIIVLADLNPIPHVLTFRPEAAEAFISFRVKIEQATVIRAAARTPDGTWHLGGNLIDAAGGGCTAPALAHGEVNWMARLGQTRVQAVREASGTARVALRMRHPMDTGLADGIPAFYLSNLAMKGAAGNTIAVLELFEPVSENPTFTVKPRLGPAAETLSVLARDTEGNVYGYDVSVPAAGAGN